jgi:hypothetical protein
VVINVDVESILKKVEEDLQAAEAQLRAAQGRVDELRNVRDGLRLAVERYGQPALFPGDHGRDAVRTIIDEWVAMSQSEATLAALRDIGRPATTREVYERMAGAGRPENHEQVRSALNYLKRREVARRIDRGLWEEAPERGETSRTWGQEAVASHS